MSRFTFYLCLVLLPFTSVACDPFGVEAGLKSLGLELSGAAKDLIDEIRKAEMQSDEWRDLVNEIRFDFKDFPSDLGIEGWTSPRMVSA